MYYKISIYDNVCYASTLLDASCVINNYIRRNSVMCHPVSHHIIANWISRKNGRKSNKYHFITINKMNGRMWKQEDEEE
jgi:hypothetical protein